MYSVLLIFLLILFFAVAFWFQNPDWLVPIKINFFSTFEASLVVVLLTALACGVMLSIFASLPSFIRKSRLIAQQQKTIAKLERMVAEHNEPKQFPVHPDPL
jgi:uncharacterized integral membrane protein